MPFQRPQPIPKHIANDKKKYCDFHESAGHSTSECRHLKEDIEYLLKEGYLTEWVKKYRNEHPPERRALGASQDDRAGEKQNDTQIVREGSIRSIFGGPYLGEVAEKQWRNTLKRQRTTPLLT